MRQLCSVLLLVVLTTVSVTSECLIAKANCPGSLVSYGDGCRHRVGRSVGDRECYGRDKIYINDSIFDHPGYYSLKCPNRQVFDRDMRCVPEVWEPNSGPWQTQHYIVRGRNLVITIRRSAQSVKVRSITVDN